MAEGHYLLFFTANKFSALFTLSLLAVALFPSCLAENMCFEAGKIYINSR